MSMINVEILGNAPPSFHLKKKTFGLCETHTDNNKEKLVHIIFERSLNFRKSETKTKLKQARLVSWS